MRSAVSVYLYRCHGNSLSSSLFLLHRSLAFFLCVCLPTSCLTPSPSPSPSPASIKAERPVHSRVQPVSWARAGGWREGDGDRVKLREEEGGFFMMMMNRSPVLHHSWGMEDGERREVRQKAPPFLHSVSPISSSFCLLSITPPSWQYESQTDQFPWCTAET